MKDKYMVTLSDEQVAIARTAGGNLDKGLKKIIGEWNKYHTNKNYPPELKRGPKPGNYPEEAREKAAQTRRTRDLAAKERYKEIRNKYGVHGDIKRT